MITLPMKVISDASVSGGQYICTPNGFGDASLPPAEGIATYSLTVEGGMYEVQFQVISSDGGSFWIRIPTGTTNIANHQSSWMLNDFNSSDTWIWDYVENRDDGGETVTFTIYQETYTLEVAYRDDGALLDMIVVTDKLD